MGSQLLYRIYDKTFFTKKIYRFIKNKICKGRPKGLDMPSLRVERFFHGQNQHAGSGGKVKVRIIYSTSAAWNAVKPIYQAFLDDGRYDILVIILQFSTEDTFSKIRQMERLGCKYAIGNGEAGDYRPEEDKPDIVIATNPWRDGIIDGLREHTKVIVAVPFTLIDYTKHVEGSFWQYLTQQFKEYKPDAYYFDLLMHRILTESGAPESEIGKAGNVKYDDIYCAAKGNYHKDRWPKLKGKKVILYATTHGIQKGPAMDAVSFDVYGPMLFEWMANHRDMGLIFRPHPLLIHELIHLGIWSKADYLRFRKFMQNSENIVFDESGSYNDAYGICDAVMTDAFCGVAVSALPLGKPIALLYRNPSIPPLYQGLDDALYTVRDIGQCGQFLRMVQGSKDPKRGKRISAQKEYIMHFDGKNGVRMKQKIEQLYEGKQNQ